MPPSNERARTAVTMAGLGIAAVIIGRISATRPGTALGLLLLPVAALAVMAPAGALVGAVALLPIQIEATPVVGSFQIGPSDLLLLLGIGGIVIAGLSGDDLKLRRIGPLFPALVVYFSALLIAWTHIPTVGGIATIIQRVELVVAAAVVGAFLALRGRLDQALNAYVVVTVLLASVAIVVSLVQGQEAATYFGVQKNPAGQAIANGLLLVLFHPPARFRIPAALVLTLGLVAAQSRGAIIATIVAVAIATLVASSSRRVRAIAVVPIIAGIAYAAFSTLPAAQQSRLLDAAPGGEGDVATEIRQQYADDAIAKFRSSEIVGTGVGNYEAGEVSDLSYTIDPHNVLLLEAAEGGVVLLAGFAVLTLSSAWVLVRRRQAHPLVLTALAVQTSTVLHGVVDVYWVRGTPVLGWLLVGAALYLVSVAEEETNDSRTPEVGARA